MHESQRGLVAPQVCMHRIRSFAWLIWCVQTFFSCFTRASQSLLPSCAFRVSFAYTKKLHILLFWGRY